MSVLFLPWLIICVCVSYLFWSSVFLTPMAPTLMVHGSYWNPANDFFRFSRVFFVPTTSGYFENMILINTNDTFQCQLYFCYCQYFLWHRLKTPVLIVHPILIQSYVRVSGQWSIGSSVLFSVFDKVFKNIWYFILQARVSIWWWCC